jgi:hypothetical protein
MAAQPTGEVVEVAEVTGPPPPTELQATTPPPAPAPVESLPATASSLPLIALCGLLALGGALAIQVMRNRAI